MEGESLYWLRKGNTCRVISDLNLMTALEKRDVIIINVDWNSESLKWKSFREAQSTSETQPLTLFQPADMTDPYPVYEWKNRTSNCSHHHEIHTRNITKWKAKLHTYIHHPLYAFNLDTEVWSILMNSSALNWGLVILSIIWGGIRNLSLFKSKHSSMLQQFHGLDDDDDDVYLVNLLTGEVAFGVLEKHCSHLMVTLPTGYWHFKFNNSIVITINLHVCMVVYIYHTHCLQHPHSTVCVYLWMDTHINWCE